MSRYGSLSDSLWGAFANPEYSPPQAPEQIGAMREGLHRIDPMRVEWHEVKANQDHICTRGCTIKRNDFYYQLQSGLGQRVEGVRRLPGDDLVLSTRSRIAAVCEDALGCSSAKIGEVSRSAG